MKTERLAALYFPVIDMSQGIAMVIVLLIGGYLANRHTITLGVVLAFVLYIQNLFEPIQQLSQLFSQFQAAGAALKKLFGLLDEQPSVGEVEDAVELPVSGAIEVRDVSFRYSVTCRSCSAMSRSRSLPESASHWSVRRARASPRWRS